MSQEIENTIIRLTESLKQHNYNYYVLAMPTISDREFDQQLKELEALGSGISPRISNRTRQPQWWVER